MTERTTHSTRRTHRSQPKLYTWHRRETATLGLPFDAIEDSLVRRTHSPRLATLTRGR